MQKKREVFLYFRELKLTFLKLFFFCVWCSHWLIGLVYPLSSKPGGVPYNYGRGVLMRDFCCWGLLGWIGRPICEQLSDLTVNKDAQLPLKHRRWTEVVSLTLRVVLESFHKSTELCDRFKVSQTHFLLKVKVKVSISC